MATFDRSIKVNVPIAEAYMLFSDFERFPDFMEGVDNIERLSEDELKWQTTVGGHAHEWTVRVTELAPSNRIAWQSTSGAQHSGVVTFNRLDYDHTRVDLHIEYEPEGFVENAETTLGFTNGRLARDLRRFKRLVEAGGAARSGWHAADGSVDEVTASDMMDGGHRRQQRIDRATHDEH
jgi:uncharacterized membrane protein